MKAGLRVTESIDLDHATHFPAIFSGEPRGVDAHRIDIVGANLRPEAGGAIVRQRNAVNHELRLILRAARVQHGIAFVKPAWLSVHQVLHRTAGQRGQAMLNRFRTDLVYRASLIGIE